jgi:hypothetical protein
MKPANCISKLTNPTATSVGVQYTSRMLFFTSYPFYLIIGQYQMHRDEMELTLRQVLQ